MDFGQTRFISTITGATSDTFPIPRGNYTGLFLTSEDLEVLSGNPLNQKVTLKLNGKTICNIPLNKFEDINNSFGGKATYDTTIGVPNDTIAVGLIIPFQYPEIPNALDIDENDNFVLIYDKGDCLAGSIRLSGLIADDIQEYFVPHILRVPKTGASDVRIDIPMENLLYLFVEPRDPADTINVYKNNIQINDCNGTDLFKKAYQESNIESGTLTLAPISLAPSHKMVDVITDDVYLVIEHGGAGTSYVYPIGLDFAVERIEISKVKHIVKDENKVISDITRRPELEPILLTTGVMTPTHRKSPVLRSDVQG